MLPLVRPPFFFAHGELEPLLGEHTEEVLAELASTSSAWRSSSGAT
jgi:crotonobetainyl-CoA:carnitine CoA-transferase CaiB-like acyl-CoA transferase